MTEERAEELRDKMRQEWEENAKLFDTERAINQSYGFNRGISSMITTEEWFQVFTTEFDLEWIDYMGRIRRA